MRLRSILDMTGGELTSSSSVTYFNEVKFLSKSVKRGDLYILYEEDLARLDEVIKNGAYGVIYDFNLKFDKKLDIAFIRVKSSLNTSLKLLRFLLLNRSYKFFLLNSITFDLAKRIITDKNVIFLADSKIHNFQKVISADSNTIFFSKDRELLEGISPLYNHIKYSSMVKVDLIESTLFESSFIYLDELYHKVKIPKIFLNDLIELISFLQENKIHFSLKLINFTEHFEPLYVDKHLSIKDFAKSDRTLILESCDSLIELEYNYLKESTKWAKTLFGISKYSDIYFDNMITDFIFKDEAELVYRLKDMSFNFVLIFGANSKEFKEQLHTNRAEIKTLF